MPNEDRQEFLGPRLAPAMHLARIGVVGLSGGGSHIAQSLAHMGFLNFALFDPKILEDKHLHRVVGATTTDVEHRVPKVECAARVIRGIRPNSEVETYQCRWQQSAEHLRLCDVIFGCVDSFQDRQELEIVSRRYRIIYLDIGMQVTRCSNGQHRMSGQVIMSESEGPCMWCLGFLRPDRLAQEASAYGDVGARPQVVWANAALAAAAIGLWIDWVTGWSGKTPPARLLSLDGNRGVIMDKDPRWEFRPQSACRHFDSNHLGDPRPALVSSALSQKSSFEKIANQ